MNQLLKPGQSVHAEAAGLPCVVSRFLGGGGQGEVYEAQLAGETVALKWYFPQTATVAQRDALASLTARGAPSGQFLWPLDLARSPDAPGFGYVMALRPARFHSIVDVMTRRVEPTFRALTAAGLGLSDGFLQLHARGLCYRDISFGNVFFDPTTGEVLICDNDNVAPDGAAGGGILGTPRFMAPEVVRGEARPSTQTDLFSLAVLLFYLFLIHHPLEGAREAAIRCFDLPAMTKLYGTEALFVFDPRDKSNAPVPGLHDNALAFWPIYPPALRALWMRSFTEGLRDPARRVRESEWRVALARARDGLFGCATCGAENFFDDTLSYGDSSLGNPAGTAALCWSCHAPLRLPPHLLIGKSAVLLDRETTLFPHHTDRNRPYDFSAPVARLAQHPTDPSRWGLRNESSEAWTLTTADGASREVVPGRSAALAAGSSIHFGDAVGRIGV